jgi:hypothetical protein
MDHTGAWEDNIPRGRIELGRTGDMGPWLAWGAYKHRRKAAVGTEDKQLGLELAAAKAPHVGWSTASTYSPPNLPVPPGLWEPL